MKNVKLTNSELLGVAEEVKSYLESALEELRGVAEYKELYDYIEQDIDLIDSLSANYEEGAEEEWEEDREYMNWEYERNV